MVTNESEMCFSNTAVKKRLQLSPHASLCTERGKTFRLSKQSVTFHTCWEGRLLILLNFFFPFVN
jgi:hypothetical protein